MFRLLLIAACLAVSVNAYSEGAPKAACRDLTPQHGAELQTSKPPYSFSGPSHVRGDQQLTLTLGGAEFLGFLIQARDGQNRVVGQFQDSLTHLKAVKGSPLSGVTFAWTPPAGYKGNVKFMATVVQTGFVYWVGRVTKDIDVE
ncbi:GH10402 [Drosophila grimshawi]|uniref:GH10402 n=1 Tax=Drosophila grimshawi TaxID=7222 RepID=B4JEB1_DROGR|nr:GH10402 [Drosophila grimshawi]